MSFFLAEEMVKRFLQPVREVPQVTAIHIAFNLRN